MYIFIQSNGDNHSTEGPAEGFNLNAASNWPLRGVKNTLWEGGVRGAALIFSPNLSKVHRVSNQTMHIVDWYDKMILFYANIYLCKKVVLSFSCLTGYQHYTTQLAETMSNCILEWIVFSSSLSHLEL